MIETIFTFVAIVFMVGIIILKIFNILSVKKIYPAIFAFLGLSLGLICWMIVLFSFSSTINYQSLITDSTGTTTITSNSYLAFSNFFKLASFFLTLTIILTAVEIFTDLKAIVLKPNERLTIER